MGGGRKKFPPFKRGGAQHFLPCLEGAGGGGAQQVSDPRFSHFVAPTCNTSCCSLPEGSKIVRQPGPLIIASSGCTD